MSTPEGKVKDYVRARMAKLYPLSYRFMPVQNGLGAPALDFYYCVGGHFLAIETKAPGKKPTPRQLATKKEIEDANGVVWIVDSPAAFEAAHNAWWETVIDQTEGKWWPRAMPCPQ